MSLEIVTTCPLGSVCEEIKDGKIHRCAWYTEMAGMDPSTGEQIKDSRCAIAWQPILAIEMSATNRGQTQAIESLRNETIKRQDIALAALEPKNEKVIAG